MPELDYFRKLFDITPSKEDDEATDDAYEVDGELTSNATSFNEQAESVGKELADLQEAKDLQQLREPTKETPPAPPKVEEKKVVEPPPAPAPVASAPPVDPVADELPEEPVRPPQNVVQSIKSAIKQPSPEQQKIINSSIAESDAEASQKALKKQAEIEELLAGDDLEIEASSKPEEAEKLLQETTSVSDNKDISVAPSKEGETPTQEGSSEVEETVSDDENDEAEASDEDTEEESDEASEAVDTNSAEGQGKTFEITIPPAKREWHLTSPSPKLNKFYYHKAMRISKLIAGGVVPCSQYKEELKKASVDMSTFVFALQPMQEKMIHIQRLRDRVTQIASEVAFQLFHWQQAKESLEGFLWQFIRSKPIAAQKGVNHEHLWDVHDYLNDLEGLNQAVKGVLENLKGAFETLSRQVTIVLGDRREIERYVPNNPASMPQERSMNLVEKPQTKLQATMAKPPADIGDFDELPSNATVQKPEKKPSGVKKVDWCKPK